MGARPIIVNTGDKFGKLTVLHEAPRGSRGHTQSVCKCECGNVVTVTNSRLVSGHTRSCGCILKEMKTNLQHGESYTRLHSVWSAMKNRCTNPNDPAYKHYGARGIRVCHRWLDYKAFSRWAKSHGYADNLTIERIDVNGNYEPGNCRFVTKKEQAWNRRTSRIITYNGKTQCLEQWAKEIGISSGTLSSRINRQHWSIKHALEEPASDIGRHGKQRPYDIYGEFPMIEQMFDGYKTYPDLARAMARYIEGLVS